MAKSKTTTPTKSNNTASSSIGVSAEDILWRKRGSRYNAFGPPDADGKRSVLELTLKGTVLNSYLRAGALSHTVSIEVSQPDLERLKAFIKKAPEFDLKSYRWPIDGRVVKFTTRQELASEFKYVWNGVGIDLDDIDQRKKISAGEVKDGRVVLVEYTPVPYAGREATDESDGFEPGCSLQLLSIGVLEDDGSSGFDFDSPRKKRRMAE